MFLVLWEVLPKALIVNPVLTSYPSALWPTFVELLKSTPQQASILTHTWATVLATVLGFTGAMVLGTAVAAALWWWSTLYKVLDPYLVVANAMPKTAFVPIFYIWLGATMSIYGMSLAISRVHHHPDDLLGLPGHRPQQDQACADLRRDQGADSQQRSCCLAACRR